MPLKEWEGGNSKLALNYAQSFPLTTHSEHQFQFLILQPFKFKIIQFPRDCLQIHMTALLRDQANAAIHEHRINQNKCKHRLDDRNRSNRHTRVMPRTIRQLEIF